MQPVTRKACRCEVRNATNKRAVTMQVRCSHASGFEDAAGRGFALCSENCNSRGLDIFMIQVTANTVHGRCAVRAVRDATQAAHFWQVCKQLTSGAGAHVADTDRHTHAHTHTCHTHTYTHTLTP